MNTSLPIGIFDSGVGGLTVYRALHANFPAERFVYLGDTARVPYGTKSLATIERYAVENARFLHRHGIKMLVVACNTASALALPAIAAALPSDVSVLGVIEPGAGAAIAATKTNRIGVIATEATINSHAYRRAITSAASSPDVFIIEAACPLFVPLAEEGEADSDVARILANKYLQPLCDARIDTLVLGCTHYPLLREVIQETMGERVRLIDSGAATAASVERCLRERELASQINEHDTRYGKRELCDDLDHFYVTDAAQRFARVAERFLGVTPRVLEAVEVWGDDSILENRLESKMIMSEICE